MKKLSTLLLCAGLLFSMAACSKKEAIDDKALDKLIDVIKQTSQMNSTSYTIDIESTQGKEKSTAKAAGSVVLGEKPQISLVLDLTANGQTVKDFADFYLTHNTTYINFMGNKMKSDAGEFSLKANGKEMNALSKLNKKMFKEYVKEASIDGKTIAITMNTKKLNSEMNKTNKSNNMVSGLVNSNEYKSLKLTIKFDSKNYLTELKVNGSFTMEKLGEKTSGKANIKLKLSELNRVIDIDLPTDLNEYKDMNSTVPGIGDDTSTDDTTNGGL